MNILHISGIITAVFMVINPCKGKIFERCELARELRDSFVPYEKIGTYVCIAERQSNFNTGAVGDGSYFGMFQLSSEFWCDINYAGKACGVQCSSLTDDDISDDLRCVQVIYDEHVRLFNNGFSAWPSSQQCESEGNRYVQECFDNENQIIESYKPVAAVARQEKVSGNVGEGKVYERCELARELLYQHDIPMKDIATWVCIAKHESGFNTSAIGRLNWDGSEDHGLFQISDIYWCGESGKSCGAKCPEFRDNNIANDVKCIKQIHAEHTRLSGDGFTAWAVYPRCKGQSAQYLENCFDSSNEIMPFKPKPGVKQPTTNFIQTSPQKTTVQKNVENGKVYHPCELARELRYQHDIPMKDIATWVCIAKHESGFNTSAIGRLNWDGSEDHGLFQISDIYWCGDDGKSCGVQCSELRDNNIVNDVKCIKQIHAEHTRLSGDGFTAWAVYSRCKGQSAQYVENCFDSSNEIVPGVKQPTKTYVQTSPQRKSVQQNAEVGKVYERCELAQELRYKHKIPMEQVATWVCIAKHESGFNTSAIGRLNADGSEDHGLFQISDIYWCGDSGKSCDVQCSELRDNEISNDVVCMLKIFEEHTRLSGDGFNAWAVYPRCKGQSQSFIEGCFSTEDGRPRPAVTSAPVTQRTFKTEIPTTIRTTIYQPPVTETEPPTTIRTTSHQPPVTFKAEPSKSTKTTKYQSLTTKTPPKAVNPSTYEPITTTSKFIETTLIDSTINYPAPEITTTTQKSTMKKSFEKSPTTAKSFNLFDLYFNSFPKGSSNKNDIKPQQKSLVYTTTTRKASSSVRTTTPAQIYDREVKLSNEINGQRIKPLLKSTTINLNKPYTTTSKKSLINTRAETTTQRITSKATTVLQPMSGKKLQTNRKAATLKPFNVFDFYLKDYTSKASINYKPIQFSDRSTVIIKKTAEKASTSSTVASTVSHQLYRDFRFETQKATSTATTVRSISIYNAFDDYSFKSNRIGRGNITPHSIDYLLKLTTARPAFRRS
jgi:lysozyme C